MPEEIPLSENSTLYINRDEQGSFHGEMILKSADWHIVTTYHHGLITNHWIHNLQNDEITKIPMNQGLLHGNLALSNGLSFNFNQGKLESLYSLTKTIAELQAKLWKR
jgi:hypothetical protein